MRVGRTEDLRWCIGTEDRQSAPTKTLAPVSGCRNARGEVASTERRRVLMVDRRTVAASVRASPTQLAEWRAIAEAAGVSLLGQDTVLK